MASKKDPSIYDDRAAIGSSEELDEYGVWVKSGPQDISEEFPAENFTADGSSADENAGISLDLSRDFSFSVQGGEYPADLANSAGTESAAGDTFTGDDNGGISDFGEFPFESPENSDSAAGVSAEGYAQFMGFDIPLDAESIETMYPDSFPEFETTARDLADTPASAGEITFEKISEDEDAGLIPGDFTAGIPNDIAGENGFQESGDVFAAGFDGGTGFTEIPGEESPGGRETAGVSPSAAEPGGGKSEVSTRLLLRIVEDLSSIKGELSSLKEELVSVKAEIPRKEETGQDSAGFFDEPDDEKIALTGAEMDNLLNAASFAGPAGNDAVEGGALEGTEDRGEPESIPIEIDMDEFGPEPAAPPCGEEQDLFEDISGLSGELQFDTGEPAADTLPPDFPDELDAGIPDLTGVFSGDDASALPPDGETGDFAFDVDLPPGFPADLDAGIPDLTGELSLDDDAGALPLDGETGDFAFDVDLPPDLSLESGEETGGAFDSRVFDSSTEDSFAQIIPEGFGDKPDTPALLAEDAFFEEDELLETGILPEDESLNADLFSEDISAGDISGISIEDISADAGTGDSTSPDSGFELGRELYKDTPDGDGEIPDSSLDLGAEFGIDALAAEEDTAPDIPADGGTGENAGEELVEFDFTEELPESPGAAAAADTEYLLDDIPFEETDTVTAEEVLPDISLEDKPVLEFPEDNALTKVPVKIREELKTVLTYMDRLLESLPEEKIKEFAQSEYFDTYKKLFEDLGLA